jgi:nitrogen regulatory protein PII
MGNAPQFVLIVTIVNSGNALAVIEASKYAGAEGGTVVHGRGTGIHEPRKVLNIPIEPEKDIVLTLIERGRQEAALDAITEAVDLNKPGNGIAFVIEVEEAVGLTSGGDSGGHQ